MTKSKLDEESRTQADKFRDLARELECDEDEAAFKAKLRKVATAPRSPAPFKPSDKQ